MTHDEARSLLKKYYRTLELANEYQLRSTDIILAVGRTHNTTSPQEREVVRRVSLLEDVQPVADAIKELHKEYKEFLELRFKQEMSFWMISRKLHMSKTATWRFENECLSAFVRIYQGFIKIKS